jgi:hypothetical protein
VLTWWVRGMSWRGWGRRPPGWRRTGEGGFEVWQPARERVCFRRWQVGFGDHVEQPDLQRVARGLQGPLASAREP